MSFNLLQELLSEGSLSDSTRAEMLELQTYLIDHVEGSERVDFDLCKNHAYGLAIHITHRGNDCDIVKFTRRTVASSEFGYGIKVKGIPMKMSFSLEALVSDVHDWLNGWSAHW